MDSNTFPDVPLSPGTWEELFGADPEPAPSCDPAPLPATGLPTHIELGLGPLFEGILGPEPQSQPQPQPLTSSGDNLDDSGVFLDEQWDQTFNYDFSNATCSGAPQQAASSGLQSEIQDGLNVPGFEGIQASGSTCEPISGLQASDATCAPVLGVQANDTTWAPILGVQPFVNNSSPPNSTPPKGKSKKSRRLVQFDLDFDPRTMTYEELAAKGAEFLDALYDKYGHLLDEWMYQPARPEDRSAPPQQTLSPNQRTLQPIYPAYQGHFVTAEEAKRHRKRSRISPKQAADLARVKKDGRWYWVKRIYESMIDVSSIVDGHSSIHRQRFTNKSTTLFEATDLEAAAHHIFDAALAVHERGWNRPTVYHKKVVRGKLIDISSDSIERRLARICMRLKASKATVDDAVRGGVTLALLCDNPEARGMTKLSNNTGNKKRGERLRMVPNEGKSKGKGNQANQEEDDDGADEDDGLEEALEGALDEALGESLDEDLFEGYGFEDGMGSEE